MHRAIGDQGGSEYGENIGPCVSGASPSETSTDTHTTVRIYATEYADQLLNREQPKTTGRCMNCAGENHIDRNCHHSERQSCTCRSQQRGKDEHTKIDGTLESTLDCGVKQHVAGWNDRWCVQSKLPQKVVRHPIQIPSFQRHNCLNEFPNRRNQKPFRDDATFDETQNYNCTDTQMDVSGATQPDVMRREYHRNPDLDWTC